MHNMRRGIIFMVLATICFALMGVSVKLIEGNASLTTELFFRFAFNFMFLIPDIVKNHSELIKIKQPKNLIWRNVFGILSIACVFYALKHLTVTNATLLNNTAYLFVPLVVWALYKVKTTFKILLGSLIGFIGIVFVLHPGPEIISPAALIGLASGLFGGIAIVMVRESTKTSTPSQILFYYALTGTVIFGLFLPFESWESYSSTVWVYLMGVGIFGALYQTFLTQSLANAPARIISPLAYLTLLFTGLLDWLIWHKIPDLMSIFGMLLIIFGGLITLYFRDHLHKQKKER